MNHSKGTVHSADLTDYEGYFFIENIGSLLLYDPYGTYIMKLGCKDREDVLAAKRIYIKMINQLLSKPDVLVD
jgi:hypothetical protein